MSASETSPEPPPKKGLDSHSESGGSTSAETPSDSFQENPQSNSKSDLLFSDNNPKVDVSQYILDQSPQLRAAPQNFENILKSGDSQRGFATYATTIDFKKLSFSGTILVDKVSPKIAAEFCLGENFTAGLSSSEFSFSSTNDSFPKKSDASLRMGLKLSGPGYGAFPAYNYSLDMPLTDMSTASSGSSMEFGISTGSVEISSQLCGTVVLPDSFAKTTRKIFR